jgi:hypothetical protein
MSSIGLFFLPSGSSGGFDLLGHCVHLVVSSIVRSGHDE